MSFNLDSLIETFRAVVKALTFRRDTSPLASSADIERFVATRAAFIAQKSLYGYLKTRIGTRYPRVFDDPVYVRSMNIAKFHVFDACLSDLAVYAAAAALEDPSIPDEDRRALALRCYHRGIADNLAEAPPEFSAEVSRQNFTARVNRTDWTGRALHRDNFSESPTALIRWAPIADRLKREDAEIVRNSIKFAWRDVREQFRKRLAPESVLDDCAGRTSTAPAVVGRPG